jgi:hypothetical protein
MFIAMHPAKATRKSFIGANADSNFSASMLRSQSAAINLRPSCHDNFADILIMFNSSIFEWNVK